MSAQGAASGAELVLFFLKPRSVGESSGPDSPHSKVGWQYFTTRTPIRRAAPP